MRAFSVYAVDCPCGEHVEMLGKTTVCEKCHRELTVESWQIRHTMTAEGLLLENQTK